MKITINQLKKIFAQTGAGMGPIEVLFPTGSFVSIIGPSGCGKSTLLRLIAGLESPTSGAVQIEGGHSDSAGDISFVFQEPALLPWKSTYENVALPLRLKNMDDAEIQKRCLPWLEKLNLAAFKESYPHQLSGGMKMRVSLARALVTEPKILLLDEPFSALDEPIRMELGLILRQIWRDLKPTIILVTHSITEAVWLSERVLVMKGSPGKIVHDNRPNFPEQRPLSVRGLPEFHRSVEFYFDLLKGSDRV